ncbi:peptidoglycan editing factor PgeF [Sediminibacillus dalangtanensis]|uniref:Purine nucleoside phosphorylase n=2 Tax=Sediminibacillus dalangtanensis TaxID=2729421 RepID=A0ABX7W005_9BACI|nr:peptidoglycan editing factor PgeF [Sediminibacillus dalangtanensis]
MKDPFQLSEESVLSIGGWHGLAPGLKAGFTTRQGGGSLPPYDTFNLGLHVKDDPDTVIANRQKLADITGFPLKDWVAAQQVHGTDIAVVSETDKGKGSKTQTDAILNVDGLITNQTGILCTAFFADCVPLYFFDPATRWIGIAHAGWRGTVNGMAEKMVSVLKEYDVQPETLLAAIGPSINVEAYQVDDKVIKLVPNGLEDEVVHRGETGTFLDLQRLNELLLQRAGLPPENINRSKLCTFKENELFFSHRREEGKTGRMLGFIGWKE